MLFKNKYWVRAASGCLKTGTNERLIIDGVENVGVLISEKVWIAQAVRTFRHAHVCVCAHVCLKGIQRRSEVLPLRMLPV